MLLLTECSMSDKHLREVAGGENSCAPAACARTLKRISLGNIRRALETMGPEVTIDPAVAVRARRAVDRMLEIV